MIPGQAEFKLLGVERHQTVQPCLELEFSDPLDALQELDGLVTIDGIESLRIERSGNRVRIFYPNNGLTDLVLRLSELIRSEEGRRLQTEVVQHLEQEVLPPAVEIPINGTILPDSRNLSLPFRAVNLAAVDVEVVKIYADNVLTFLQESEMEETYEPAPGRTADLPADCPAGQRPVAGPSPMAELLGRSESPFPAGTGRNLQHPALVSPGLFALRPGPGSPVRSTERSDPIGRGDLGQTLRLYRTPGPGL